MASQARQRKAFSLVELSTAIGIIAVVAAMAAPRYANSLALYRAQAAAQRIVADVNLAKWQAKISSSGQSIVFNTSANGYSLPGMAGLAGLASPYSVNLTKDPYQATLLTAVFTSGSTLTFDRFGQPSAGGTISVQVGRCVKTILVDATTGVATVQ